MRFHIFQFLFNEIIDYVTSNQKNVKVQRSYVSCSNLKRLVAIRQQNDSIFIAIFLTIIKQSELFAFETEKNVHIFTFPFLQNIILVSVLQNCIVGVVDVRVRI